MNPESVVVLYSKYSQTCKPLLELYNQARPAGFTFACVDNRLFREKLLSCARLNVQSVPCVLFFYPDQSVEKLEGPTAPQWLTEEMSRGLSGSDGKTMLTDAVHST
jgi:hypothetical protein